MVMYATPYLLQQKEAMLYSVKVKSEKNHIGKQIHIYGVSMNPFCTNPDSEGSKRTKLPLSDYLDSPRDSCDNEQTSFD